MPLLFWNKGVIDPIAIKTFGVSAKATSNPIGYFGTGLKYGIAVTIRSGGRLALLRGNMTHSFSAQRTALRGKEFELLQMDGESLPFTTELGKNWEPWMAYREFYCNALDEGGGVSWHATSDGIEEELTVFAADGDYTVFVVHGLDEFFHRHAEFFWQPREGDKPLPDGAGYYRQGKGQYLFYKGVRVAEWPSRMPFDYNLLGGLTLSEDRVADAHSARNAIAKLAHKATDPAYIRAMLLPSNESFMYQADLHWYGEPSSEFMAVLKELAAELHPRLNRSALKYLPHNGLIYPTMSVELNKLEKHQLLRSIELLEAAGFQVSKYPIIVADTLGENIMGRAANKTIYLAKPCFEKGTTYVASTLLEEYVHLHTGHADESLAMQQYLFDLVVRLSQEATGKFL